MEFRGVTARYTAEGPDILKNISFTLKSGELVAIVGRTGSGKSTLVLSLLRVTHIVSGSILYDGKDITHLPLQRLRQFLTIIPQDTALFSGDVGENLDPSNTVDRHDLQNALSACSSLSALSSPTQHSPSQITLSTPIKRRSGSIGRFHSVEIEVCPHRSHPSSPDPIRSFSLLHYRNECCRSDRVERRHTCAGPTSEWVAQSRQ